MEILAFVIPFITALLLLIFFRRQTVWFEYIILIAGPILFVLLTKVIITSENMADTEYLGQYVEQISYYEDWDELVDVRHEEEVYKGKDSNGNSIYETRVWYTQEREYHHEYWTYKTSKNDWEHHIGREEYNLIKARFAGKDVFRDMHRDYYRKDGDAYDMFFDGNILHMYDLTTPHAYNNRIKAVESNSIFKYSDIAPEEARKKGLFEYPDITPFKQQNPILGRTVSFADTQRFKYINAKYGPSHQFRVYILLFNNPDVEISEMQKAYWQGGNKNEFVVCLGLQRDSVLWCNPFSWCDEPKLEVMTKDYFINNPHLDLDKYGMWLQTKIPGNWKRKEFVDFKYIRVNLTHGQEITLLIFSIIISVGCAIFVIGNDITNDDPYYN